VSDEEHMTIRPAGMIRHDWTSEMGNTECHNGSTRLHRVNLWQAWNELVTNPTGYTIDEMQQRDQSVHSRRLDTLIGNGLGKSLSG
jgi:hypothetical protein